MPKKLPCSKEEMILKAREVLLRTGYDAFTVREVAAACGVSVGTVYTYFDSKNALVIHAIAGDWFAALEDVKRKSPGFASAEEGIGCLYAVMRDFEKRYNTQMLRYSMKDDGKGDIRKGVRMLSEQISGTLAVLLRPAGKENDLDLRSFLTTVLMAYARNGGAEYETIRPYIHKLLQ